MDVTRIRAITNYYQDARLLSLRSWKRASEFEPRDSGGPYVVSQEGYDPEDLLMRQNEFVLGRSGQWVSLGTFFHLPVELRKQEFIFGTAAEVIQVMDSLSGRPQVRHANPERGPADPSETHDLNTAVEEARGTPVKVGDLKAGQS